MKLKPIERLQEGGAIGSMFLQAMPISPISLSSVGEKPTLNEDIKSGAAPSDKLNDKLLEQLFQKGLTNDVYSLISDIDASENEYMSLSDAEKNTSYGKMLLDKSTNIGSRVNEILRNRDQFDLAKTALEKAGALDQLAVTNDGNLFAIKISGDSNDRGQMVKVSFDTYNQNPDKYIAQTNAQMLSHREKSKSLVNDLSTISAMQSAVGYNQVLDKISKLRENIGYYSDEKKSNIPREYLQKLASQGLSPQQANAALAELMAEPSIKTSEKTKTNLPHIQQAQGLVWNYLSESEKNALRAEAARNPNVANVEQSAKELALDILALKKENEYSADEELGVYSGASGASAKNKETKIGPVESALNMASSKNILSWDVIDPDTINSKQKVKLSIDVVAARLPNMGGDAKTGLVPITENEQLLKYTDITQAQDGMGQPLPHKDNTMLYGNSYVVELPVIKEGNNVRIDTVTAPILFEFTQKNNELKTKIEELNKNPQNNAAEIVKLEQERKMLPSKMGIQNIDRLPRAKFLMSDAITGFNSSVVADLIGLQIGGNKDPYKDMADMNIFQQVDESSPEGAPFFEAIKKYRNQTGKSDSMRNIDRAYKITMFIPMVNDLGIVRNLEKNDVTTVGNVGNLYEIQRGNYDMNSSEQFILD